MKLPVFSKAKSNIDLTIKISTHSKTAFVSVACCDWGR